MWGWISNDGKYPTRKPEMDRWVSQKPFVLNQRRRTVSSSESSSSSSESSGSGSESESENEVSEDEQPESPHQKEKTTPAKDKSSPDYMDTTPSPSRNWGLRSFLQSKDQNPQLISMNTKQLPCEAPPSDKSDPDQFDEVNDVKRPADHISDENQPSVDEFSPPAPIDTKIPILSPIKSPQPIKSPAKRTIHRTSVAERLNNSIETPPPYKDTYTNVKNRERKTSLSKPSPEITDTVKGKTKRGRKSRPKVPKSKPIVNDDSSMSECESDVDVVNNSLSSDNGVFSPKKSLPVSPKKSGFPLGHSSLCSPKSLSSAPRKKESKRDKLLREKEIVKLKQERVSPESVPNKVHCDKNLNVLSSAQSGPPEADSIEKILHSFPEKEPLSPIPNMPDLCQNLENLCKAGLAVTPIKPLPLNGSVSYKNGKPSVWVKLDLSLIKKFVSFNKNSSDILHLKPLLSAKESVTPNNLSPKHQKLTSSKTGAVSSKVLPNGRTTSSANSSKQCEYTSEQITSEADHGHKPSVPESVSERSIKNSAIPDFNSLPIRQKVQQEKLSDASSSDSSDSESDSGAEESKSAYISPRPSSAVHSSFPQSSPDKKKRKLVSHTEGDTKRRKTVRSKSPHKQSEPKEEISLEEVQSSRKKVSVKRERHPSTSSQHSTHSTLSQHSTHSHHSSHSYKPKRVKVGEGTPSHDLKPSSTLSSAPTSAGRSAERLASSSSASSAPSKHPIKLEVPAETAKYNGYSQQSVPSEPSNDTQPPWRLKVKKENEVFLSADEYHQKAKKYKHQADAMEPCLARYMLYMESVLSFIQSGCAMERNHMIADAANMYKDTYKIITHQYNQFRLHADPDAMDKSESKLTVLCVRIQSLVYLKLYMLKRNDNMKMKSILEDHYNKSVKTTSHPKPPSAPSPHQTNWNRSTGTPSPMSPTPSPANSVCSVGSVGSDATPSKMTNGTSNSTSIAPPGSVIVPQRIDSIARKYFAITNYMVMAHELWEQANLLVTPDIKEYFAQLDYECGPLTITSGLNHLVKYVRQGIANVKVK